MANLRERRQIIEKEIVEVEEIVRVGEVRLKQLMKTEKMQRSIKNQLLQKKNMFLKKFDNFRCEISGNLRMNLRYVGLFRKKC